MKNKALEKGNIYFFYSPKVGLERVEYVGQIQRFYIVLSPTGRESYRVIVVPQKKLPDEAAERKYFAFVDEVVDDPVKLRKTIQGETYQTKTRGERTQAAYRPIGEGVYVISKHDDHTHLTYSLELPEKPSQVQEELGLEEEDTLIISVKNPQVDSPPGTGLDSSQAAKYPRELQEMFEERRFMALEDPEFLEFEGTQLLLVAVDKSEIKDLEIELKPQKETVETAEIFNDLRMLRSQHPIKALFEGKWA